MNSIVPSDPKPTKEAYLTALRILRENHKVSDDPTGSPHRRAQLFQGEESRITSATDANAVDTIDSNNFLASIALGGRSERRNIPQPTLPTRKSSILIPSATEIPPSQASNKSLVLNGSSEKIKKVVIESAQPRLSNGSDSTGGVIKFGRKATRRFTIVSNMLPKYKLDEVAKQKIAIALKEINCWSDDDDYEAVKKLKAIEEDSDLSSGSDSEEFSLEALASQKHTNQSVKAMSNSLKQSTLVNKKTRGLQPQTSSKSANIQPTPPAQTSAKERPNLMRPKHTIYQTKQQSAKQAYLEQQKELQRQQAKEVVVKKAVKLIIKLRAEEESQLKRSELAKKYNLSTLAMLSIESIALARVNKILKQGLALAVEKRIKLNKKSKRRLIRENRAASKIFWCYRKYRVHMLLFCVVKFIRAKAVYFKNQEIQEERDYRMRTAMRRVKEDKQFKIWQAEQSVKSTFPVKPPPSEFAPIIAFTRKNYLFNNPVSAPPATSTATEADSILSNGVDATSTPATAANTSIVVPKIAIERVVGSTFMTEPGTSVNSAISSPRPPSTPIAKNNTPPKSPRAQPAPPSPVKKNITKAAANVETTNKSINIASATNLASDAKLFSTSMSPRNTTTAAAAAIIPPNASVTANSLVPAAPTKPKELSKEQKEFNYHRPDLAPFSTMINNLVQNNSLFKSLHQSAEPSWVDVASVSADYGKVYNSTNNTTKSKLKSPAYAALEKFCGVTQEDLERRKLAKNKDLVNLKLKSFGHSIVSL